MCRNISFFVRRKLPKGCGFYSEQWFDIGQLRDKRDQILELGRACIDSQYRNSVVFRLLFSGLGAYLHLYPHNYLIGLTTLFADTKNDVAIISWYLAGNDTVNFTFDVKPLEQLEISASSPDLFTSGEISQRDVLKKMSTLMFTYYKYGATFVSKPIARRLTLLFPRHSWARNTIAF